MAILILIRRERYGIRVWKAVLLTIMLAACGVIGAKLLYALENGFRWGGISFYGSVWLIPILMPLIGLLLGLRPTITMDLCAPAVTAMVACLRFNCLLAGCCGGWLMEFGGIAFRWPTQMMESLGDCLIMFWLLSIEQKEMWRGKLYGGFLLSYGGLRFMLEFLRNTPKNVIFLSNGQWFSVAALLIGWLWIHKKHDIKAIKYRK